MTIRPSWTSCSGRPLGVVATDRTVMNNRTFRSPVIAELAVRRSRPRDLSCMTGRYNSNTLRYTRGTAQAGSTRFLLTNRHSRTLTHAQLTNPGFGANPLPQHARSEDTAPCSRFVSASLFGSGTRERAWLRRRRRAEARFNSEPQTRAAACCRFCSRWCPSSSCPEHSVGSSSEFTRLP